MVDILFATCTARDIDHIQTSEVDIIDAGPQEISAHKGGLLGRESGHSGWSRLLTQNEGIKCHHSKLVSLGAGAVKREECAQVVT